MLVNLHCLRCSKWCHRQMGKSPRTGKEWSSRPWLHPSPLSVAEEGWVPPKGLSRYLLFRLLFILYSNCWFISSVSYPGYKFLDSYDHDLNVILLMGYKNWRRVGTLKCTLVNMLLLPQGSLKVLPFWNTLSKVRRALGKFKNLILVPLSLLPKTLF